MRAELVEIADFRDEFMQTDRIEHAQSYHRDAFSRSLELSRNGFGALVAHSAMGSKPVALPKLRGAVTALYDLASRSKQMIEWGRYRDVQDQVAAIGGEVFRLSFYPLKFLEPSEADAIRKAARSLLLRRATT